MMLSGPALLITAYGQNGGEEFRINVMEEILQAHAARVAFVDEEGWNVSIVADGVALAGVANADNTNTVALLRGGSLVDYLTCPIRRVQTIRMARLETRTIRSSFSSSEICSGLTRRISRI
jgi:hypothetical protein